MDHSGNTPSGQEWVTRVRLGHEVRPGAPTVRDVDFRNPGYMLTGQQGGSAGTREDRLEQFHYRPGAFLMEAPRGVSHDENFASTLAERGLAADRTGRRAVAFEAGVVDLGPGTVFAIDGHPHPDLQAPQAFLVTEHQLEGSNDGEWSAAGLAVMNTERYRPAPVTPRPRVRGVQSATVVGPPGQEIHTDEFGRVRVQFPWDRLGQSDDDSSVWLRVSQGWAGPGFGAFTLPRVGHEVLVSFLGGNPDMPVVVGRLHNQREPVPYPLPDNKTVSGWKTDASPGSNGDNEIQLEDKSGSETVSVQAERNLRALVKNDAVSTVGHDRAATVGTNLLETTDHDRTQVTGGTRVEQTGRNRATTVGGNSAKKVAGDHSERVDGTQLVYVAKDRHLLVKGEKRERIDSDSNVDILGGRNESTGGDSLSTSSYQVKIGKKVAIEAGDDLHHKADVTYVGEGASSVMLLGPGGFIGIDASGVTIMGTLVMINAGGSPGSAADAAPASPMAPQEAKGSPVSPHAPPNLEIADGGGTAITTTQTTIVGKKVTLQVRSVPGGQALTHVSWVIPGENVKSYTQSSTTATRTDLAAADLQGTTLSFFWISGGTKTVEVTALIGGAVARATATFNVLAPTNMTMSGATGSVTVDTSFNFPGTWLHYGNPNTTPAIAWTFTATAPAGGGGDIEATQLLNVDIARTDNAGAVTHLSSHGHWMLDTSVPYAPSQSIAASAAATWSSSDSPGAPLTSGFTTMNVATFEFHMYFMYKPSGADSIWVTLGRLDWHWRASSTRSGAVAANTWSPPAGLDANSNPSGSASTELPTWTANFTSLTFA